MHSVSPGSISETDGKATRENLKEKLYKLLDASDTNLTPESLAIVSELEKLNPVQNSAERPDLYKGPFQLLNSTMQDVLYRGAVVTLGRATFNAYNPLHLNIRMREVYNDVGMDSSDPDSYIVAIPFSIIRDGDSEIEGLLINRATCPVASSNRLDVFFLSSILQPLHSGVDLSEWLRLFKDQNPDMDDRGVCKKTLPPGKKGWLDIIYLDDELRITKGNFGTITIVRRLEAQGISY